MGVIDKCGKPAGPLVPRYGWSLACVLDKGHDGQCERGGTCAMHGEYVGETCPKFPECIKDIRKIGYFEESFLVIRAK